MVGWFKGLMSKNIGKNSDQLTDIIQNRYYSETVDMTLTRCRQRWLGHREKSTID
jgi:hypothetical protein